MWLCLTVLLGGALGMAIGSIVIRTKSRDMGAALILGGVLGGIVGFILFVSLGKIVPNNTTVVRTRTIPIMQLHGGAYVIASTNGVYRFMLGSKHESEIIEVWTNVDNQVILDTQTSDERPYVEKYELRPAKAWYHFFWTQSAKYVIHAKSEQVAIEDSKQEGGKLILVR